MATKQKPVSSEPRGLEVTFEPPTAAKLAPATLSAFALAFTLKSHDAMVLKRDDDEADGVNVVVGEGDREEVGDDEGDAPVERLAVGVAVNDGVGELELRKPCIVTLSNLKADA